MFYGGAIDPGGRENPSVTIEELFMRHRLSSLRIPLPLAANTSVFLLMAGLLLCFADAARADRLVAKGTTLNGKVKVLSSAGLVRGEYDITKRIYAFASTDALYDAVQDLSLRAIPKAGVGYILWQREPKEGIRDFVQIEGGGGWVYEKYFGGEDDDYFTVALGASAAIRQRFRQRLSRAQRGRFHGATGPAAQCKALDRGHL